MSPPLTDRHTRWCLPHVCTEANERQNKDKSCAGFPPLRPLHTSGYLADHLLVSLHLVLVSDFLYV